MNVTQKLWPASRTLACVVLLATAALAGCSAPATNGAAEGTGGTVTIDMKDLKFSPATLTVPLGTTVTWVNKDNFDHTVTPVDKSAWGSAGSGDDPSDWIAGGESYSYTFTKEGTYVYYCIPHAAKGADGQWRGMVATITVSATAAPLGGQAADLSPPAALAVDVPEIGRDGDDVPAPIGSRGPEHLTLDITAKEVVAAMGEGITYSYWTFEGTVPGPMLRARVGDTITVNFHNDASSTTGHNIDFHAVTGPGGGAAALDALPGETKTLTFKALNAGLYVYHCAYQNPPLHVAQGMYGLILIEPAGGLEPVDEEFYVVQSDFYSGFPASALGHHAYSSDAALDERPSFVVFNGRMASLKDADRQLHAEVGDRIRMFVGNGGPNLVSSFHIIGEIFDRVYQEGSLTSPPLESVQTTLVPAGGATMVEFDLEVPGDYFLVDHSIFRVAKGAFGVLHVEGEDNPEVFASG